MIIREPQLRLLLAAVIASPLAGITSLAQDRPHPQLQLSSVIAFTSNRDDPFGRHVFTTDIYVAEYVAEAPTPLERLTNLRNLTQDHYNQYIDEKSGDVFGTLEPNGRRIVFDSTRLFAAPTRASADLFVMDWDGENVAYLTRGSSATWSPHGRWIAYHASASGLGAYIRPADFGSATFDSDIFALNVDDAVKGVGTPINLTMSPEWIDEDADWSPDGTRILFTRHLVNDPSHTNPLSTEIWVMDADGSNQIRLTNNDFEERGPAWSPDGTHIAFACRIGPGNNPNSPPTSELCVMTADGSDVVRLTFNTASDFTPTWSPDGQSIIYHSGPQLTEIGAHGGVPEHLTPPPEPEIPEFNILAKWGNILVRR